MLNHHFEVKQEAAQRRRYGLLITGLLIFLFTAVLLSFWVGYYPCPLSGLTAFLSRFGYEGEILPQAVPFSGIFVFPRILSAVFIGASLSTAGAAYQGMFRNPLVSPDILGVSSGASLGAAFAILFGASNWLIQLSAFAGGTAAVAASYLISRRSVHSITLSLVLTGSMIMALCNAGVTMIKYVADPMMCFSRSPSGSWGALQKPIPAPFYGA